MLEELGWLLFHRLTHDQRALQERIVAVAASGSREIVFRSEWLGYLPFGIYCWIEHTDADGVTRDIGGLPFGFGERDLAALERRGVLEKIDERRNPDDSFDYSVTYAVRPGRLP